ncbi:MAG: hypothetical protein RBQ72_05075 [Desulfobacterium sp.]|jgi:hypothetical protein|nr:hypothetical protein [Desulfobacterium sp.]
MTDCLVFNHHSLPFEHRNAAEEAVPGFLKICIEAKNTGLKTVLVDQTIDASWFRLELAPGYFWKNWHDQHQNGETRDLIRAFRSIATQSPFFNSDDIMEGADLYEVMFDGCKDYGALCAAAWHGSPLTSFETRPPWNDSPLQVNITRMNPETTKIENQNAEIQNFYSYSVFSQHLPELLEQRNVSISSGKEIVNRFEDLYPGVFLCGKATQQLNNWSASISILNQVKRSLLAISQFAQKWQTQGFVTYSLYFLRECGLAFQVSGESKTVGNNSALRREREFWLPSGRKEYFEQHVKMSAGYRLHFYPDNEKRQIYVGYIGPHLRLK